MGGAGTNRPLPSLPPHSCAQCQLLPSPLPAGPQRQWCQPWGCQEAGCHANGPGWVGAMVMSDSELLLGLWASEGRGHEEGSPAGQLRSYPWAPRAPRLGLSWSRGQQALGCRAAHRPHPGTASRAPTCTVPVLRVTLGQVLAESSGGSAEWTAGRRQCTRAHPGLFCSRSVGSSPHPGPGTSEGVGITQGRCSQPTQRAQGWQVAALGTLGSSAPRPSCRPGPTTP